MMVSEQPLKILIIGTIWPEPRSSAAGVRGMDLVKIFKNAGWEITFVSPSPLNDHSKAISDLGIQTLSFSANDARFDSFISSLKPDFAVFDRFVMEEQFGWRVHKHSPDTIRVLDTVDLHFLRKARQSALAQSKSLDAIFDCQIDLVTEDTHREIAAIYRSDLTLLLSDFEHSLLKDRFQIPDSLLLTFGFCYPPISDPILAFQDREHFSMIGNFRHPPNADATRWLKNDIWPMIRKALPESEVHIYGAYPPREIMALDDPKSGFRVLGPAAEAIPMFKKYRVALAPLRFGAGIKGKISDAWAAGTPSVTTPIGSEGMGDSDHWGGIVARSPASFAEAAICLYSDEKTWESASEKGRSILHEKFNRQTGAAALVNRLKQIRETLADERKNNFVGGMLWHHFHKSTTYFSKWIELKNFSQGKSD